MSNLYFILFSVLSCNMYLTCNIYILYLASNICETLYSDPVLNH